MFIYNDGINIIINIILIKINITFENFFQISRYCLEKCFQMSLNTFEKYLKKNIFQC